MLKGILLSMILLACAAAGRSLSNARRRRAELLADILAGMRVLRLRMLNSMEPIGILLRKSDCRLFSSIGNNLREGYSLNRCWLEMRETETQRRGMLSGLAQEEMRLLDDFFQHLGTSGREEQNALFSGLIPQLEEAQAAAHSRYQESSRLYTGLGALIGIGICILIA